MTRNLKIFANQFLPFLAARQASDLYVSNFIACLDHRPLGEFVNSVSINCWIDCAFCFAETPEGVDFWARVHKDWQAVARHF